MSAECHMPPFEIVEADLNQTRHQRAVIKLIDAYAKENPSPCP